MFACNSITSKTSTARGKKYTAEQCHQAANHWRSECLSIIPFVAGAPRDLVLGKDFRASSAACPAKRQKPNSTRTKFGPSAGPKTFQQKLRLRRNTTKRKTKLLSLLFMVKRFSESLTATGNKSPFWEPSHEAMNGQKVMPYFCCENTQFSCNLSQCKETFWIGQTNGTEGTCFTQIRTSTMSAPIPRHHLLRNEAQRNLGFTNSLHFAHLFDSITSKTRQSTFSTQPD